MRKVYCVLFLLCSLLAASAADVPRTLYVINGAAETLSKLNLETGAVKQNVVKTGQIPNDLFVHRDLLYVLNSGTSSLQVIDPRRDQVVKTIVLKPNANPWAAAVVGRSKVYVSNWAANSVSVLDLETGAIVGEFVTGKGPQGILVVDDLAFVCVSGYAGWGLPYEQGNVLVVDTRTDQVLHALPTPTNPQTAALAPDGRVHVLCTGDYVSVFGKIAVIDLYTGPNWDVPAVVDTIDLGGSPGDLKITPEGKGYAVSWGDGVHGFMYLYAALSGTVLRGSENPLLVGPNVSQVLYDGREGCLWIPFMTEWGGDGFVQKWDIQTDMPRATSPVLGSGCQKAAIVERIWEITPWADRVFSFSPGAAAGRGLQYFPDNVLGPPDQTPGIDEFNPSNRPQEVLSLGHGGEIVLEFVDNVIVDGPGVDFTVFENAFMSVWDGKPFIEAGIVAVSQNGVDFVEFPYDLETWRGLAGVTPTQNAYQFMDPLLSGGDSFDLADVGLSWAKYVKITDLGDMKQEGPWNGDFDLDAVVALHYLPAAYVAHRSREISSFELGQNYPNPFNASTTLPFRLQSEAVVRLEIVDLQGRTVRKLLNGRLAAGEHRVLWDGSADDGIAAASGVYFARLRAGEQVTMRKVSLLR